MFGREASPSAEVDGAARREVGRPGYVSGRPEERTGQRRERIACFHLPRYRELTPRSRGTGGGFLESETARRLGTAQRAAAPCPIERTSVAVGELFALRLRRDLCILAALAVVVPGCRHESAHAPLAF